MTVSVEVTVGGRAPSAGAQVLTVRVASRLAQPAQCEVTLDPGPAGSGWVGGWPLGEPLAVRVAGESLFDGEVTAVELVRGPDGNGLTRVRGYDRLHRLRQRQQVRVFESVTVAGLVEAVAGDLGVTVEADEPGPRVERLIQHRQHDLGLLVEAAGRAGLYPVLRGDTLRLVTLAGAGEPVKLHYGQSLWEARVEANLDRVAGGYTAWGWHPQRAEVIEEKATSPRSGRHVSLRPGRTMRAWTANWSWSTSPGAAPTSFPRPPRRRWTPPPRARSPWRPSRTGTPGCGRAASWTCPGSPRRSTAGTC